jgi:tetratricopeptide (TPR) repeat protein
MLQIIRAGDAIVAERYTYIPMIGVYYFFVELTGYLIRRKVLDNKVKKGLLLAVVAMPLIVFTFLTRERCGVWNNSLSLWNDVIGKFPCVVAYTHRGLAYSVSRENDLALQDYAQAIMLDPDYAPAYNNRGKAYKDKGEYDRAIENYTQAIRLYPRYAKAYDNRGIAYKNKGENGRAIEDYSKAIAFDPGFAAAYNNRGVAYNSQGDHDRAIEDFNKAILLNPGYALAYYNRGIAYKSKGDDACAESDFSRACDYGVFIACKHLMYQ